MDGEDERRGEGGENEIRGFVVMPLPLGAPPSERQGAVMGYLIEAFNGMDSVGSTLGPDARLIGMMVHDRWWAPVSHKRRYGLSRAGEG